MGAVLAVRVEMTIGTGAAEQVLALQIDYRDTCRKRTFVVIATIACIMIEPFSTTPLCHDGFYIGPSGSVKAGAGNFGIRISPIKGTNNWQFP